MIILSNLSFRHVIPLLARYNQVWAILYDSGHQCSDDPDINDAPDSILTINHKPDTKKMTTMNTELQVKELQEDLRISIDVLCQKNMKYFETILGFYTDHLKKSIDDSADRVIHSLSVPYDRLQHKVVVFHREYIGIITSLCSACSRCPLS